jgi:hypothetical protein
VKALMDMRDGDSQNHRGGGHGSEVSHWPSTGGHRVSVGTCQRRIGVLKSDILM